MSHIGDVYWSETSLVFPLVGVYCLPPTASRAFGVSSGIRFIIVFVVFLINLAYQHNVAVLGYSAAAMGIYFVLLYMELHQLSHANFDATGTKHVGLIWNGVQALSPSTFLYDTRTMTPLLEFFLFVVKATVATAMVTEHIDDKAYVPAAICYPSDYADNKLLDKGICPSGLPLNYADNETMAHACDVLYADTFRPVVCFLHKGQALPYHPVSRVVVHLIWTAVGLVALYIALLPTKYRLSALSMNVLSSYMIIGLFMRFAVLMGVVVVVPNLLI